MDGLESRASFHQHLLEWLAGQGKFWWTSNLLMSRAEELIKTLRDVKSLLENFSPQPCSWRETLFFGDFSHPYSLFLWRNSLFLEKWNSMDKSFWRKVFDLADLLSKRCFPQRCHFDFSSNATCWLAILEKIWKVPPRAGQNLLRIHQNFPEEFFRHFWKSRLVGRMFVKKWCCLPTRAGLEVKNEVSASEKVWNRDAWKKFLQTKPIIHLALLLRRGKICSAARGRNEILSEEKLLNRAWGSWKGQLLWKIS